jgi:hypothetical protein
MPYSQYLEEIRCESAISQHLWVKVLGMLQQNWCVTEPARDGGVDMVFFDDHGEVFDWLSAPDLATAHTALDVDLFQLFQRSRHAEITCTRSAQTQPASLFQWRVLE